MNDESGSLYGVCVYVCMYVYMYVCVGGGEMVGKVEKWDDDCG